MSFTRTAFISGTNWIKKDKKEMKLTKKELMQQLEALRASNIELQAKLAKGRQSKGTSTYVSLCHAIIAGNGKGYLNTIQLGLGLEAVKSTASKVDIDNQGLFKDVTSKIVKNLNSNIKKQQDVSKAIESINSFERLLNVIDNNIIENNIDNTDTIDKIVSVLKGIVTEK